MCDTTVYSVVEFVGKDGRQYGHYTEDEIRKNTGQSFQLGDYDGHVFWMEEQQYYTMRICFIGNLEDALDRRAQLEAREMTPKESVKRKEVKQSKATRKRRALLAKVAQLPAPEEEPLEDVSDVTEDDENMDLEDNGMERGDDGEDRENKEIEEAVIELEDEEKRPENIENEIAQTPIVDAQTVRRQSMGAKPNNRKRIVRNSVDEATLKRARKSDLPGSRRNGQDNASVKKETKKKEEEGQRLAKEKAEEEKRLRAAQLEEQRLAVERAEEEKRQRNAPNGSIDALLAVHGHGQELSQFERMKKEREDATHAVERKRIHLAAVRAAFISLETTIMDELERAEKTLESANRRWEAVVAIQEASNEAIKKKVAEYEREREKKARKAMAKAAKKQAAAAVAPPQSLLTSPHPPSSSSILPAAVHQVDAPNEEGEREEKKSIVPKDQVGKGNGAKETTGDEEEDQEKDSRENDDEESAGGDESEEGQEDTVEVNGIGTPSNPSGPFVTSPSDELSDIPFFVHHSAYNPPVKTNDPRTSPSTSSTGPC